MKFSISKDKLLEGLSTVQNVVSTRTTLPILSNVLLQASDGEIRLTTTDLDVGIRGSVEAIEEIRQEVPRLIVSLQVRTRQLARALEGDANIVMSSRVDRALAFLQKEIGDRYDREIERFKPGWLQARFEILSRELRLNQI